MAEERASKTSGRIRRLTVQLTRHCNLNCYYCYCHPLHGEVGGIRFDALIRFLEACRPYSSAGVTLTGGEPLIYPQIDLLLDYLRVSNQFVALETNGYHLSERTLELLSPAGAHVAVTLESVQQEQHDLIRGKGAFLAAVKALRLSKTFSRLTTQFTLNLTPNSRGDLLQACDLGASLGVKRIKLNPIYKIGPRGRSEAKNKYLSIDDLLEIAEIWSEKIHNQYPFYVDLALPPALLPRGSRLDLRQCSGCELGGLLGVLYDGTIRPCHNFIFDKEASRLGSIYAEYSVSELLETLSKMKGASFLEVEGICRSCALLSRCKGFCRAQANVDFGNTSAPNLLCDQLFKSGRFPEELITPPILC